MIGLDPNVLVRYLVRDDAAQAAAAAYIVEEACTPESPGFLNQIVLCEFVWTLARVYSYRRAQISTLLILLLRTDRIQLEEPQDVALAIRDYMAGHDCADSLIMRRNRRAGCDTTLTFDRRATRLPSMQSAQP